MDYPMAAVRLKAMTGILETGLFDDICGKIIVPAEADRMLEQYGHSWL